MKIGQLTGLIVDRCIKIHSNIGPGCFEKVYEEILYFDLLNQGIKVDRQVLMPVSYQGHVIRNAYKLDLLVENKLILEIKSTPFLPPVYFKQLKTYLSIQNLKHGMLLNFHGNLMKDGIFRVYNNFGREELIISP